MVTAAQRIIERGDFVLEEKLTAESITPGHLVEFYNASGTEKVRKHTTAKGFGENAFALEDALQGNTIADAYASGDLVSVAIVGPGAIVRAWLKTGTNYVIGDKLESAGDGTLQKISGSADLKIFGTLLEAVDLSASGAVATRASVRIH